MRKHFFEKRTLTIALTCFTLLFFHSFLYAQNAKKTKALLKDLQNVDENIRVQSVVELGKLGRDAKKCLPHLIQALTDTSEKVQEAAIEALAKIAEEDTEEIVVFFVKELKKDNIYIQRNLLECLGRLGGFSERARPTLLKMIENEHPKLCAKAVWTLGQLGPEVTNIKILLKALYYQDPEVRANVLQTLAKTKFAGKFKTKNYIELLIESLEDPNEHVRGVAALELGKLGPRSKKAVPGLIRILKDSSDNVKMQSILALGEIGPDAKESLPSLEKLLQNTPNKYLQSQAAESLDKISKHYKYFRIIKKILFVLGFLVLAFMVKRAVKKKLEDENSE